MKKILQYIIQQIKAFIINPFWLNGGAILLIILTLAVNALVWYLWIKKYQDLIGVVPISYSSAVIVLNIFLGNLTYRKETLVTFILLGTGLIIQIIYLIFLRFFAMSQAF